MSPDCLGVVLKEDIKILVSVASANPRSCSNIASYAGVVSGFGTINISNPFHNQTGTIMNQKYDQLDSCPRLSTLLQFSKSNNTPFKSENKCQCYWYQTLCFPHSPNRPLILRTWFHCKEGRCIVKWDGNCIFRSFSKYSWMHILKFIYMFILKHYF